MNRFEKSNPFLNFIKKIKWSVLFTIAVLILSIYGISSVETTTDQKQMESLENAISRSVIQCYAVEGTYPPNLSYLEDHYGLTYDSDKFFVDYQIYGSNMMPDVTILRKGGNINEQ